MVKTYWKLTNANGGILNCIFTHNSMFPPALLVSYLEAGEIRDSIFTSLWNLPQYFSWQSLT